MHVRHGDNQNGLFLANMPSLSGCYIYMWKVDSKTGPCLAVIYMDGKTGPCLYIYIYVWKVDRKTGPCLADIYVRREHSENRLFLDVIYVASGMVISCLTKLCIVW